jgi:hypothetical protein
MSKFVLLYTGGSMPETEAEQAKVMQDWADWYAGLGDAVADPGNPIGPVSKKITSNGSVSDGSGEPMVTGYTILSADSLDEAVNMAKKCPVLEGGSEITVFESFDVM